MQVAHQNNAMGGCVVPLASPLSGAQQHTAGRQKQELEQETNAGTLIGVKRPPTNGFVSPTDCLAFPDHVRAVEDDAHDLLEPVDPSNEEFSLLKDLLTKVDDDEDVMGPVDASFSLLDDLLTKDDGEDVWGLGPVDSSRKDTLPPMERVSEC